jgi:hypothetical protein
VRVLLGALALPCPQVVPLCSLTTVDNTSINGDRREGDSAPNHK